ncbi:MAG: 5'-nucleotidase C-terminal domain-containing protein [Oscillospiraceae bacterium]|nr:5'-nucleotidase C-terminal domain-containing protein [Oscillospiraceae bacterium]
MKNINRMLALVMALAMIFSLSITASAAVTVEWSKERYQEAATKIDKVPADLSGKTVILHTNDIHGAVAQYAKLAALKADFVAAGATVVMVDAGDYSSGDPNVSLSKGASAIELMNAVGYDYATLGNHEFDAGWSTLVENLKSAKFTVLSDVQYQGKDAFPVGELKTLEESGLKLGFFGLTTPETATKAHPGKTAGVSWPAEANMMKVAQTAVDKLKADGADLVIGITHLGTDAENVPNSSRDLYKEVTGIDFIVDGHSHTVMTAGEDKEPIQSTGTKLVNVGVIVIDNAAKKIESNCLFDLANYTKEVESVKTISDRVIKEVNDEYGAVFAVSAVDLDGANKIARYHETNLGDLIADAMLWHIKEGGMDAVSVPADRVVALTNGGGIREDIKAGDVTRKDVNAVLPFGNTVAVVYVTGAELLEALEASTIYFPMGGFPQVAGIQYTIDDAKTFDQGEQYPDSTYYGPKSIQRVTINSINGRDFDPKATYAVITNDFLASGGDTYFAFKNASAQFDTSIEMDIVVMDYITTELKGTITAEKYGEVDGRITIKEDPIKVYTDVDVTEWYAPALRYVVTAGSMTGTGAATFAPKATITRAEVMKLIANMAGADTKPAEGEQWYDKAVAWAVENKISDGKDATSVSSREDFVIMLYNYIKMQGKGLASDWSFSLKNPDADQLSENATEAMQWMVENGVIKGVDDAGTLAPKSSATRAEMAQILLNMSKVAA